LPDQTGLDYSRQKLVQLGGCCISDDSPAWTCLDCKHCWGTLEADAADLEEYFRWIKDNYRPSTTK
jgi:hypothetical protein